MTCVAAAFERSPTIVTSVGVERQSQLGMSRESKSALRLHIGPGSKSRDDAPSSRVFENLVCR